MAQEGVFTLDDLKMGVQGDAFDIGGRLRVSSRGQQLIILGPSVNFNREREIAATTKGSVRGCKEWLNIAKVNEHIGGKEQIGGCRSLPKELDDFLLIQLVINLATVAGPSFSRDSQHARGQVHADYGVGHRPEGDGGHSRAAAQINERGKMLWAATCTAPAPAFP